MLFLFIAILKNRLCINLCAILYIITRGSEAGRQKLVKNLKESTAKSEVGNAVYKLLTQN